MGSDFTSTWCVSLTWTLNNTSTSPVSEYYMCLFLYQLFANSVHPGSQYNWFQFNICALPLKNNAKEVNNKRDQLAKDGGVENSPPLFLVVSPAIHRYDTG